MGLEELTTDERFIDNRARVRHRKALNARLVPRFRERSSDAWLADLRAADVLAGPVYELDETFRDPQVLHNGTVITLEHPRLGPLPSILPGFRLPEAPDIPRRPPPALGADTEAVLGELGYDADQVAELRRRGVV